MGLPFLFGVMLCFYLFFRPVSCCPAAFGVFQDCLIAVGGLLKVRLWLTGVALIRLVVAALFKYQRTVSHVAESAALPADSQPDILACLPLRDLLLLLLCIGTLRCNLSPILSSGWVQ